MRCHDDTTTSLIASTYGGRLQISRLDYLWTMWKRTGVWGSFQKPMLLFAVVPIQVSWQRPIHNCAYLTSDYILLLYTYPKIQLWQKIKAELKVAFSSINSNIEYLQCNVLSGCAGKEFLVFITLHKKFPNSYRFCCSMIGITFEHSTKEI